ncbi:unnamed protein product [Mortierella alpina]
MARYSIGYSSDDFLSGANSRSGDPASLAPKDELDTSQEWEIIDQPRSGHNNKRLVFIRNIKSQNYLALKKQPGAPALPNDEVILNSDDQQIWELNDADEQGQYFIQLPQQDGNGGAEDDNELVMDALWVDDRLTVALQPKKGRDQTWSVTRD